MTMIVTMIRTMIITMITTKGFPIVSILVIAAIIPIRLKAARLTFAHKRLGPKIVLECSGVQRSSRGRRRQHHFEYIYVYSLQNLHIYI